MRKHLLWTILLLAALTMAGCQPAGNVDSTPAVSPEVNPAYPAGSGTGGPGSAYPPAVPDPILTPSVEGSGVYPMITDGSLVNWLQAVTMIQSGEVTQVAQAHDLTVTITLRDGRTVMTTEPSIDEVLRVIEDCGAPCQNIAVATE